MFALLKYHTRSFIRSNKFVMPLIVYLLAWFFLCSSQTDSAKDVYVLSIGIAYFMAVWSGFVYAEVENNVTEQIAMLKAKSIKQYYISKVLFTALWGIVFSVISLIIPILWKVLCMVMMMDTFANITVNNVIISFVIHIIVCALGGIIGYLLHPRVFNDRKIAGIATFSMAFIGLIKGPFNAEFHIPMFDVFTWVFPPIYEILNGCSKVANTINIKYVIVPCMVAIVYAVILGIINVNIINKKGF